MLKRSYLTLGAVLLAVTLASPAFAVDALFGGTVNRFQYGYFTTFATVPTTMGAVAQVQAGSSNPGFSIASNVFDGGSFSYTAAFPGYPYFKAYRDRFMTSGAFDAAFKLPNTSYTVMRPNTAANTQYPNALPTNPALGFMRVKAGPKGFGGFWGANDGGTITGTAVSLGGGGGFSDFFFKPPPYGSVAGLAKGLDHAGGKNNQASLPTTSIPQTLCCQYSNITNQTNTSQMRGKMGVHLANVGHITGTITVSGPTGYATLITYMGADARTSMGLNGTISMVAPALIFNHSLSNVPSFDGTTQVVSLDVGGPGAVVTSLTFLPEPTQIALLASGVLGLFGLRRTFRR